MRNVLIGNDGKMRCWLQVTLFFAIYYAAALVLNLLIGYPIGRLLSHMYDNDVTVIQQSMVYQILDPLSAALTNIICCGLILWTYRKVNRCSAASMGLSGILESRGELILGAAAGLIAAGLLAAVLYISGSAEISSVGFPVLIIVYCIYFVSAAMLEEYLVRGAVQHVIYIRGSAVLSIVLPSLLFGLVRLLSGGFRVLPCINIVLFGLLMAVMTYKTGSLYLAMGFHCALSFFMGDVFGLGVRGLAGSSVLTASLPEETLWNGGAYGAEGGLFFTILMILLIVAFSFVIKKRNDSAEMRSLKQKAQRGVAAMSEKQRVFSS